MSRIFPNSLDAKNLWKEFQSFGRIVDAFITNKRSKQGKHFGFVRFLGVHNEEVFAKSLFNVWIGNYHVFVAVARFQRNPKNDASSFNKPHSVNFQLPRTAQPRPNLSTNVSSEIPPKKSYASVAHAETSTKEIGQNKFDNVKSIQLSEDDIINVEDTSSLVMVKVKEIDTISNMYRIEISGLPLCAWGSSAFKKVANLLGKFNFFDDDAEDSMSSGRACILTKSQSLISEKVNVDIKGVEFQVHVKEIERSSSNEHGVADPNGVFDDFVQQVEEEDDILKTSTHMHKSESFIFPETLKDVKEETTHQVAREGDLHPLDLFKDEHIATQDDKSIEEGISDTSKPPGFENFIKENKEYPRASNSSRLGKCSTSFGNFRRKELKGFSFLDEMNRMIEVGGALGYDVRGCKKSLRKMINGIGVSMILGIQETKMTKLELFQLRSMWGNFNFDYGCSMARGTSGGLVTLWDPNVFIKKRMWCSDNYIILEGKRKNVEEVFYIINVYGPQHQPDKSTLWSFLRNFILNHPGKVILFGDLNEVRYESERFGSIFSSGDAAIFNDFIQDIGLIDLPMGGRNFTWMNKVGSKMSKLDRFLISNDVIHDNPNLQVVALDRVWSDHNPILLHSKNHDFGPTPFKVFHSWFNRPEFKAFVKDRWAVITDEDSEFSKPLHIKLKDLKSHLKLWYSHTKETEFSRKASLLATLRDLEKK
ncbi:RNA-directed DNA polymerase, eukaryota, reverse transcriptase zinc-binding domain protein [Tanacetum coccineum]